MVEPRTKVALVGPMGAGKSSVGRALADRTGWQFVDLDAAVEADAGATVAEIFAGEGEAGFRARERAALEEVVRREGPTVIATGGGAVLDEGSRALLRRNTTAIWLTAPPEVLARRIGDDPGRPLLIGRDPAAVLTELLDARAPLYEAVAHLTVDTGDGGPDELAATIHEALEVPA